MTHSRKPPADPPSLLPPRAGSPRAPDDELQSANEELERANAELRKEVRKLDEAYRDLENLFHGTQIPTLLLDSDLRIKRFTRNATELFRLTESDLGRSVTDIAPRFTDEFVSALKMVQGTVAPMDRKIHVAENGSTYLMQILPYRRLDNIRDGLVVTFQNITQLTQAHEQRAGDLRDQSQRKDQFLAVLSHELRGPLASLRICVNLLESKVTGGGRTREAVEIADRQLEHLASLVDQLLDASRIARGKFVLDRKVRDFVEIVRTSAEDQRRVLEAGGVQLTVRLPAEPLWVNVDALRVSQIIVNLLGNALKFSPQGGQAELTVARDEAQNAAVLRVRDEGAGIAPEVLPQIFQPFTRVDPADSRDLDGLGLGLALVQSLVQTHGGSVEAKSEGPGRGTEIIVRLPLVQPADAAAASRESARPSPARRRIMVVEDHRDTAKSMRWSLEARGHEVVVVSDGHSALATVPTFHPEVVLCDIGLPGGMDGYGIAEAIRHDSASGNPYLIAVTGYGMPADRARAMKAGFDHFVVKGGPPRALLDLVDRLAARPLDSATPGREAGPK